MMTMRAGAGPHDLGPGDNSGDAFPELVVQSNVEPVTSGDEDPGGEWAPDTDDPGPEPDFLVRNTPRV